MPISYTPASQKTKSGKRHLSASLVMLLLAPLSTSIRLEAKVVDIDSKYLPGSEETEALNGPSTAKVDERVELVSIAYRLAGSPEFLAAPQSAYTKAVDRHFNQFANHGLVRYIKDLNMQLKREGKFTNGWEVISLAAHISNPPDFVPLTPFGADKNIDAWDNRTLLEPEMLALLRQFYHDTKAADFFSSQTDYYRNVNAAVAARSEKLDTAWVAQFFGIPPTEKYQAILSLFGVSDLGYIRVNYDNERRDTYTIIAISNFDAHDMPANLSENDMNRLNLHEILHTYANQLVDTNLNELYKPAEVLLRRPETWARVKNSFYNNAPFLMRETMVRAAAIKYVESHGGGSEARDREIAAQEKAGFVWMSGFLKQLDNYERNRERYPTLSAFMPSLINFFEVTAARP